jgi:hypothetical protein
MKDLNNPLRRRLEPKIEKIIRNTNIFDDVSFERPLRKKLKPFLADIFNRIRFEKK